MTKQLLDTPLPTLENCPILSGLESISHGFFGRRGGVSSGIYSTLNCGYGSDDSNENVSHNRTLAVKAIGLENEAQLCTLYQTHSNDVITTDTGWGMERRLSGDGLVTRTPGVALGILTADCTPVLFADPQAGVIGAAHAGWKGACSGILENTVATMVQLGADTHNIHATIGPTIAQSSYEIGPEFYERFLALSESNTVFFKPSIHAGHHMFDLPGYVISRLSALQLAAIGNVEKDTCTAADDYFSYRRTCLEGGSDYGRNLALIALKA